MSRENSRSLGNSENSARLLAEATVQEIQLEIIV